MLSLKDLIIFILIFIFIYLIFEYFFSLSPKIIEAGFQFDESIMSFKDIPSMFDINLTQVNDLSIIQGQIKELTKKQDSNTEILKNLKRQFSDVSNPKS